MNRLLNAYEIRCCSLLAEKGTYSYSLYVKNNSSGKPVSGSLVLMNINHTIFVANFHPKLNPPEDPNPFNKGLSRALFYLLVAHYANNERLPQGTEVNLESQKKVFNRFYNTLDGFGFQIGLLSGVNNYCVSGRLFNFDPRGDYSNYILFDDDILPNSHLLQSAYSK
jgi:hypothetical protein